MEQDRKPIDKSHLWVPIFDKGGKNIHWGKNSLFNISGAWKTGQLHVK